MATIGSFIELTIDNEQLTIEVSLRDDSNELIRKAGEYPETFQFHNHISFIPGGDSFIVNCQLSTELNPSFVHLSP